MNFFKHVGIHNNKKVVIIEKSIPNEPHMCLVIYAELLPTRYHDDIMKLLESDEGQAEKEFGLILNRRLSVDGRNLLQIIAQEGYLKKVQTAQVQVKPNAKSSIRLDELNNLLSMAGTGQEAINKLEQLERETGLKDSIKNPTITSQTSNDVLDDTKLAESYISQSVRMRAEAAVLVEEAKRLEDEAKTLNPQLNKKNKKETKSGRGTKVTT